MKKLIVVACGLALLTSCVSKKKMVALEGKYSDLEIKYSEALEKANKDLTNCQKSAADCQKQLADRDGNIRAKDTDNAAKDRQVKDLQGQIDYLKSTNTNLLDRLSDMSIVSKQGAENIKKSLESMNDQNKYIKNLNTTMQRKDSVNLALVTNLKRSLADVNDQDVQVKVEKGVVYISISDRMLFKSGSADINTAAETILGKVASVVNDHKDLDILVEGHTDNVPMSSSCMIDNWDLSAKRATSVVRLLQKKFGVAPGRMTAGGRSEYEPKITNDNAEGRKLNRRTEIIILPKLDQFFQLSAPK
jgi:chemotaxis protein MotB